MTTIIPLSNGYQARPEEVAEAITDLANWISDHEERVFECDCDASYESDTNAWNHQDRCASHFIDSALIVLRSTVAYLKGLEP